MSATHPARTVKILIASPSDVEKERDVAEQVIHRMKITCKGNVRLILEPVRWEMDVPSEMGEPEQEIINRYVDECDCAICIFWTRIGTETTVAPGGAVEEFERMLNAKKPVMLYLSHCSHQDPHEIDPDQLKKLKDWKLTLGGRGISKEYRNIDEFEKILTRELEQQLRRKFCENLDSETGERVIIVCDNDRVDSYRYYREALLNQFRMLVSRGLDDYQDIEIPLEDIFIDLQVSDQHRIMAGKGRMSDGELIRLSQDELLRETFHGKHRTNVLLLIGDPGSGKTTLLQHYAMLCLDGNHQALFPDASLVRIVFIELRKLKLDKSKRPLPLAEQIAACNSSLSLSLKEIEIWWVSEEKKRPLLVLLDGLDEVTELEKRQNICEWIDEEARSYPNRFFVVTSRRTGYVTSQGVELTGSHRRATVQDLKIEQQRDFLIKWFRAASEFENHRGIAGAEDTAPAKDAEALFHYLYPESEEFDEQPKKGLQELAGIPLLLKLMALLYKMRGFKPDSRIELYRVSLDYLLRGRDRVRKISLGIDPEQTKRVLALLAYTMHRENRIERSPDWMKQTMESRFADLNTEVHLDRFFDFVVDRGGILVPFGDAYRFRHKTYQEYLAGMEMVRCSRSDDFIRSIVQHFGDEEWEWDETLRFYFAQIDADVFDVFMDKLFAPQVSTDVLSRKLQLMRTMIRESKECSTNALCRKLEDPGISAEILWYVLDCLETINKPLILETVRKFQQTLEALSAEDKYKQQKLVDKAADVVDRLELASCIKRDRPKNKESDRPQQQKQGEPERLIRNPYEYDAQYILIPGGQYLYSLTKQEVSVKDLYVAKYPVTNRQYRSFIDFLAGKPPLNDAKLSLKAYQEALLALVQRKDDGVKGFQDYLTKEKNLVKRFSSTYNDNRKFNKDDQPVVGVSWYAARAYCLWLSLLEGKSPGYRLPTEKEWEWAAGGKRDEPDKEKILKVRQYPWGDQPEPTAKHANYGQTEGATTPVGSYPDGATPDGLYDIAGNVWEWMENWYDEKMKVSKALRGGSWGLKPEYLRCRARYFNYFLPDDLNFSYGFRVVRPSPPVKI